MGDFEFKELLQKFHELLFDETLGPTLQMLILQYFPDTNWQEVNETLTSILRLWCSDVDRLGGASEQFEFDDNLTPICCYVRRATLLADSTGESFTWTNSVQTCTILGLVLVRADAAVRNGG